MTELKRVTRTRVTLYKGMVMVKDMVNIILALVIGLFAAVATASAHEPLYSIPNEAFVDNNTQRQEFGYGIGADVVVLKTGNPLVQEITIEPRYDIENRETRVFGVVRVDLFEAWELR